MSSGDPELMATDTPPSELNRIIGDEQLQRLMARFNTICCDYDIPFIGGCNEKGTVFYLDKDLPTMISGESHGQKISIEPLEYIKLHSQWEKVLMDGFGYYYVKAHLIAAGIERRAIVARNKSWQAYTKALEPFAKAKHPERIIRVPSDLDLTPYQNSGDHQLLSKMKSAMITLPAQRPRVIASHTGLGRLGAKLYRVGGHWR